jgi:hypothetical protein
MSPLPDAFRVLRLHHGVDNPTPAELAAVMERQAKRGKQMTDSWFLSMYCTDMSVLSAARTLANTTSANTGPTLPLSAFSLRLSAPTRQARPGTEMFRCKC